jgi:hypothetical protein
VTAPKIKLFLLLFLRKKENFLTAFWQEFLFHNFFILTFALLMERLKQLFPSEKPLLFVPLGYAKVNNN